MTEASYTAWDDKQYVWPPPDGWYEAPDGKWWPEGYGPPQVVETQAPAPADASTSASSAVADVVDDRSDMAADVSGQALSGTGFADATSSAASGVNGWVSDGPGLDAVSDVDPSNLVGTSDLAGAADLAGTADLAGAADLAGGPDLVGTTEFAGTAEFAASTAEAANGIDVASGLDAVSDIDVPSGADGLADAGSIADAVTDVGDSSAIGELAAAAPSMDQSAADASTTIVGSESFDASTSAATQAFGTGLMPPMADRPAAADLGTSGGNAEGFHADGLSGPPGRADLSASAPAPAPESFEDLAAAAPVTSPPPMDHVAEQQAILDAKPKGSSRGLLFAILGVVALVIIGAALFFALGGDADTTAGETVTTGPGSVSEPHPRVTGVVVFYPDADVEQRWIVEVLEPVRDVSEEFENDGSLMLAATRVRVTNDSGVEGASLDDLRFNLVDAAGAVIVRTDNSCPPGVDDFGYAASVAVQDSVEGTVCWAIPSADLAGLILGIESSKVQGRVHIQLQ